MRGMTLEQLTARPNARESLEAARALVERQKYGLPYPGGVELERAVELINSAITDLDTNVSRKPSRSSSKTTKGKDSG